MTTPALWAEWEAFNREAGETGCICYPVVVTTDHAASSYHLPVVLISGEARGSAETPPGELQIEPAFIERAQAAGYPCQSLSEAEREEYWTAGIPLRNHWHPEARLIRF